MYYEHFGFNEPPFSISPDPRFLFMSERHRDALAHLVYGAGENGGFVLLTGAVGTGKTTLIRSLLKQELPHVETAVCLHSGLSVIDFIAAILDELHVAYAPNPSSLKPLIDALNKHLLNAHAAGKETVLIIDEGQNLSREVLEQVRLLTNLETDAKKLLRIILVGQEELLQTLGRDDLRQLSQRITTRYHLTPLNLDEVKEYIAYRLKIAKGSPAIFSTAAIRQVYRLSEGVPRLINILCDRALLAAFNDDADIVQSKHINIAAAETQPQCKPAQPVQRSFTYLLPTAVLVFILLFAGGYAYLYPKQISRFFANISQSPPPEKSLAANPQTDTSQPETARAKNQPPAAAVAITNQQDQQKKAATLEQPVSGQPISEQPVIKQPIVEQPINKASETELSKSSQSTTKLQVSRETSINNEQTPATPKKRLMNIFDIAPADGGQSIGISALLQAWHLDNHIPFDESACQYAQTQGMVCISGNGTIPLLQAINRPVLLELIDANNRAHWITIKQLGRDKFTTFGLTQSFEVAGLLRWWSGNFVVLLKQPNVTVQLSPGFKGEQVKWLRQRIAVAEGKDYSTINTSLVYDKDLVERVKVFQKSRFITDDGIVGNNTLIYLFNIIADDNTPILTTANP